MLVIVKYLIAVGILFRSKIIPFYAIILRMGCSKAELIGRAISYCNSLGLKIGKILLDRGFLFRRSYRQATNKKSSLSYIRS